MSRWYAIYTKKKDVWSIGTFGVIISKYFNNNDYVVLGPFSTGSKAQMEVELLKKRTKNGVYRA